MESTKVETTENPALNKADVICSALQDIWDFIENQEYNYLDGKMIKFANDIQFKIEAKINEVRNGG